jgi:hypothetical protein
MMKDIVIRKWWVWLWIATLFIGFIMVCLATQFDVLQSYILNEFDLEAMFLLMVIPFIIGIGMGIYYQKGE